MKNEFTLAFNEVLEEKQLPKEVVLEALKAAMISAYRRAVNASNAQHVDAVVDADTGKVSIYAEKEVVDEITDEHTEVLLREAVKVDPEAKIGSMVIVIMIGRKTKSIRRGIFSPMPAARVMTRKKFTNWTKKDMSTAFIIVPFRVFSAEKYS